MNLIEERLWGKYEVLLDSNVVKVKKITVNLNKDYHINITIKDKSSG